MMHGVSSKVRFPLEEAYSYGERHGLVKEMHDIKSEKIVWHMTYNSDVRRGRIITLFRSRQVLSGFFRNHWPRGLKEEGRKTVAHCERVLRMYLSKSNSHQPVMPEEVPDASQLFEGATQRIAVNSFERNPAARAACVKHHGSKFGACEMDFETTYGAFAAGYIHVHHKKPLSEIGATYVVDPVKDLVPLCPNCHAATHIGGSVRSVNELKQLIATAKKCEKPDSGKRRRK